MEGGTGNSFSNSIVVKAQYDRLKAEAEQTTERLQQAESKLEVTVHDLNSARQSAYEAAQTATRDKQQAHSTITNLQVWTPNQLVKLPSHSLVYSSHALVMLIYSFAQTHMCDIGSTACLSATW